MPTEYSTNNYDYINQQNDDINEPTIIDEATIVDEPTIINEQNNIAPKNQTLFEDQVHDLKYCHKCFLKTQAENNLSEIEIFNRINQIIFNAKSMPDVYSQMEKLDYSFSKWTATNEDGFSVFHWFVWFISVKIKKYNHVKPKVYAFFQKVFSDNTVESIFSKHQISSIVKLAPKDKPYHTILYHMVRYCENPNDNYYKRLYKLLLDRGAVDLNKDQLEQIRAENIQEETLPDDIKMRVSDITSNYKNLEDLIIKHLDMRCPDYEIGKCINCNILIDYTREIPKIVSYAKKNNNQELLNMIYYAFYQRRLLNKVFDNYYSKNNIAASQNLIHKRHTHVIDIYTESFNLANKV